MPGIHTYPLNDLKEHVLSEECWCDPDVEWIDPKTELPYHNGPLVIHHSADKRELSEELDA